MTLMTLVIQLVIAGLPALLMGIAVGFIVCVGLWMIVGFWRRCPCCMSQAALPNRQQEEEPLC